MSRFSRIKNNKGSTLVIVLVVVAFVAILGTAALTSAMLNLKMKMVDREAKKSFYTAEEAVDQLYAGLGKLSMENLNIVYQEQVSRLTQQTPIGESTVNTQLDNNTGNAQLRKNFATRMVNALFETFGGAWNGQSQTVIEPDGDGNVGGRTVLQVLNSFIEDTANIRVKSVGGKKITVTPSDAYPDLYNYFIEVYDCTVEYKAAADSEGYFANVTVDLRLGLPDVKINFTEDANNRLTTFEDFSIIGCSGIQIQKPNIRIEDTKVYAGDDVDSDETGGLRIGNGASLAVNGDSAVVSAGVIQIGAQGAGGAGLSVSNRSRLWCKNLSLAQGSSNGRLTLDGTAFVKDDLTVDGSGNEAVINGNYIGWSYEGERAGAAGHVNSSAMIVNGKGCKLDMRQVTSLILGGRSYVDVGGTDSYMTGESLSLRANQEIYLVPGSFLKRISDPGKAYANPVLAQSTADVSVSIPSDFFALPYLVAAEPYRRIQVGNLVYYYLNIDEQYADAYIASIMNYDASKDGLDVYRAELKNLLVADLTELQQQALITNTGGSTLYANGALIHAQITDGTVQTAGLSATGTTGFTDSAEIVSGSAGNVFGRDSFSITAMDLRYRFMMITQLLYEPSFYSDRSDVTGDVGVTGKTRSIYTEFPGTIVIRDTQVDVTGMTDNVFSNFINTGYLRSATAVQPYTPVGQNASSAFKVYITNRSLPENNVIYIDDKTGAGHINMNNGLIITDGDVVVKQDFNGLILAAGTVTVDGSVTLRNTYSDLEDMLSRLLTETDRKAVKQFFKAWNQSDVHVDGNVPDYDISGITYKKIVAFNNWRKSDVANPADSE